MWDDMWNTYRNLIGMKIYVFDYLIFCRNEIWGETHMPFSPTNFYRMGIGFGIDEHDEHCQKFDFYGLSYQDSVIIHVAL